MALGHINASKHSFFWGLLVLSILLYIFLPANYLNLLFGKIFGPVLKIGVTLTPQTISQSSSPEQTVAQQEYDTLWKKYQNLQARQAQLEKENLTLSRMRKQFGFSDAGLITARIITQTRSTRQELIINQGSQQGIAIGQIVLSPQKDSVIGIVKETAESISRIGLLTDSAVSIEVRIRRDDSPIDIPAQMFGDGKNGCQVRLIPRDKDIRKGDTVYAAPHPGKLDVPVIIGQVKDVKVDQDKPLLWSIGVEPIEPITNLNQVIIVVPLTQ